MSVLTFLSDFGSESPYPAAMRAVAACIAPSDVRFLDLTHEIRPQLVREGAFVLASLAPECPDGTVHCAVVDPGVGTERQGIVLVAERQTFVGPDNGLMVPAAERVGPIRAAVSIDLTRTEHLRVPVSSTFHGRDVFAPVAAHLASGVDPSEIGPPVDAWETFDGGVDGGFSGGRYDETARAFQTEIVYVDRFGNLVTNLLTAEFDRRAGGDARWRLQAGDRDVELERIPSFGHTERGALCLVGGSHERIEIAVREGSAQAKLDLDIGAGVTLRPR